MNLTEHLLATLVEEACEVAQACTKALRFGLSDGYPGTDRTNLGDIKRELANMDGVIELLHDAGVDLREANDRSLVERKKQRVLEYMEYARRRGTLTFKKQDNAYRAPVERDVRMDWIIGGNAPVDGYYWVVWNFGTETETTPIIREMPAEYRFSETTKWVGHLCRPTQS